MPIGLSRSLDMPLGNILSAPSVSLTDWIQGPKDRAVQETEEKVAAASCGQRDRKVDSNSAAVCEVDAVVSADSHTHRRVGPIRAALMASVAICAGFAAYHRIGTEANAEIIEFTTNIAGGFLAVGMTDDQPGFVFFSAIDRPKVNVSAECSVSSVGGVYTELHVTTPATQWYHRLRGPLAILVGPDGKPQTVPVAWTVEEFKTIRNSADCLAPQGKRKTRCGAPFADLDEVFGNWPAQRVPAEVRTFAARYRQGDHSH